MSRRLELSLGIALLLAVATGCDTPRSSSTTATATDALVTCTRCHGDPAHGNAAPPRSVTGLVDTTQLAVGAHQAHLAGGSLSGPIACAECHVVPATVDAPGHMGKANAAVVFGAVATANGSAASWDRTAATCVTYCHGATLSGGTSSVPRWTQVDGTQAACGTCHGLPPASPHVQSTDCNGCHPGYTVSSVVAATHVDGRVEIGGAACMTCHGDSARNDPAPPRGTNGETATSTTAVGAHQSHLVGSALRGPIACSECHVVPNDLSHVDGRVDLAFGPLATAGGAVPSFDGATCASTYCHGATLNAGGTNPRPTWTQVDGTQAACGTCHAVPPPAPHPSSTTCGSCHAGYTSTSVNVATHIDGQVDASGMTCTSCHGQAGQTATASSPLAAAPPVDTTGASTGLRVGAHQKHLLGATYSGGMPCQTCHASVASYTTLHANGTADVSFSGAANANLGEGTYIPRSGSTAASCASTWCHAVTAWSGASSGGTLPTPSWNGSITACTACHGVSPSTGQHQRSQHLDAGCGACHSGYTSTAVNKALHVNGTRDVGGAGTKIDSYTSSTRSCSPQCHGNETW